MLGVALGDVLGLCDAALGGELGLAVGLVLGMALGLLLGEALGKVDGRVQGRLNGMAEGFCEGSVDGDALGVTDGRESDVPASASTLKATVMGVPTFPLSLPRVYGVTVKVCSPWLIGSTTT